MRTRSGTIVFDLDGTLADTSGDLIAAANVCFRALGHPDMLTPDRDAGTALRGGRAMLTLGFDRLGMANATDLIDAQYPRLLHAYGAAIAEHTTLYDGARETVARLKAAGHRVTICTNKPEGLAEKLMHALDFRTPFDALVGADTLPVRKPDPAPYVAAVERASGTVSRSIMIGDTLTDRNTARAAGVPCVLVTFSPEGDTVSDLKPDALLHHFDDLPDLAAQLFSAT